MSGRGGRGWSLTRALRAALGSPEIDGEALREAVHDAAARRSAPVLWLLGTAQSGKTSIVRALTGSSRAEIGDGFRACTRTAGIYDFPVDAPVVSFLDTRGLGEVDYDPADDIALCESRAQLLVVVMKVTEARPQAVPGVLRAVRQRHPDWPVVIAQTCLHEAYPDQVEHVLPYPFGEDDWAHRVPDDLRRLLLAQREALGSLPGGGGVAWVPIDFTREGDGFEPRDYGIDALWQAIEHALEMDLRARLGADSAVTDVYARVAHPRIVGYSTAAAAAGALPLVDLALVPAIQARLLHLLAGIYGLRWSARNSSEFLGLLGAGFAVAYGLRAGGRSVAKLVPGWGQTLGAVWGAGASGAVTFALGKAGCAYLARRREGHLIEAQALREVYREALGRGRELIAEERRRLGRDVGGGDS